METLAAAGALLGKGNTADVYDLGDNKVVKLFHAGYPRDAVHKEFRNSQLINALDVPVTKSYGLVSYHGRLGIVYDKADGVPLLDVLLSTQDIQKCVHILASIHKQLLRAVVPAALRFKSFLEDNIKQADAFGPQQKSHLLSILDTLPDGERFCHGDFHFGNIMLCGQKNYVIDYMNVCRGHAYADIARTVYLIEMTPVPEELEDKEQILAMKKAATDCYLREMAVERAWLKDWLIVIAAARIAELRKEQKTEKHAVLEFLSTCG